MNYIMREYRIMSFLGETMPKALEDGKLTVAEILDILQKIFEIFEVQMINIPDSIKEHTIEIVQKLNK